TARPETKFGDKYVVMHPDDERYLKYKDGDKLTVEWMNGPIEATIIKDPVIDKEFGTGVMTITPSHSHVDFDLAQKHKLDIEQIIDTNGRLLAIAGEFSGMKIEEAREKIVERLKEKGLFVREEPYHHQIATAERTGAVIEPQVMRQWFVDVNKEFNRDGKKVSLKSLMQGAVREGDIKILPERFEKTYFHWIDNLRDWCISRQIWFGHRIPVWYCLSCENPVVNAKVKAKWFLVRHGETDWNKERRTQGHQDSPLNETGREQAHRVALQLKNHDIGLIISSDLGRCKETAEVIAKATGAPVDFDEALRERYYGEAEGLLYEETENQFGHPYASYEEAQGNAESPKELEERIASAFSRHKETHGHKNVVIVSHGASLRMLMKRIRNLSFDDARRRPGIKNAESFSLDILETPCEKCGNDLFEQDPDTLDTWFSSGLWTFSTLGWPDEKEWAKNRLYHPTALLETGYDILFFWVARMILMSEYLLGEAPFKTVYLHGLVRDEKGRKMTKSLGNVLNPLDVIDRYGADALRLALLVGATPGNDIKLDDEKVTALRNLVNKIWNMGRYVTSAVDTKELQWKTEKVTPLSLADDWILFRLGKVTTAVSAHLENFNLSLATDELRDFTWSDVADWYIEIHKIEKNDAVLVHVFNQLLTLWHPFMPFVTEAVFASLYPKEKFPLMVQAWPQITASETNAPQAEQFEGLKELITRIRNIRSLYHIDPKELLTLTLIKNDGVSEESFPLIERLGRVKNILLTEKSAQPKESARVLGGAGFSGFVHLSGVIDVENERGRLTKEKEGLQKFITNLESRLSDSKFTERAPKEIIDQQRVSLEEARAKEKFFQESITHLN
ncbi:MAG: class I tRNA ligase family protein, partial [Candidatus Moraniibacteriota bacterium]